MAVIDPTGRLNLPPPRALTIGRALEVLDIPRQKLFEAITGKKFGREITGGGLSGFALDVALDPLNLLAFGSAKALKPFLTERQARKLVAAKRGGLVFGMEKIAANQRRLDAKLAALGKTEEQVAAAIQKQELIAKSRLGQKLELTGRAALESPLGQFITSKVRQRPSNVALQPLQDLEKIVLTESSRVAQTGAAGLLAASKEIAKATGGKVDDVQRDLTFLAENVHGVTRTRPTERAQQILNRIYDQHPAETAEHLLRAGRLDELKQAEKASVAWKQSGVSPVIARQYANMFMEVGAPKRAMSEIVSRRIKNRVDKYIGYADELNSRLATVDPRIKEVLEEMTTMNRAQLEREMFSGMNIRELDNKTMGYVAHRMSAEGRLAFEGMSIEQRRSFLRFVSSNIGARLKRTIDLPIDKANKMLERRYGIPRFFSDNPAEIWLQRELMSGRGRANALYSSALADMFAVASPEGTSLATFFNDVGITRWRRAYGEPVELLTKQGKLSGSKLIEANLAAKGLAGLRIPQNIIHDAKKAVQLIEPNSPFARQALRGFDRYMGLHRAAVTVGFPAFHLRNMLGNFINGAILGNAMHPSDWANGTKLAFSIASNKFVDTKLSNEIEHLLKLGVAGRGMSYEMRSMMHTIPHQFASRNLLEKAIRPLEYAAQKGFDVGQFVEDSGRIAHFLGKKRQGLSDLEALASVNKYLFDYEHGLTMFEKSVGRRLAFFYTWTRFNIPLQIESVVNPQLMYKAALIGKLPGIIPDNMSFTQRRLEDRDRPAFLDQISTVNIPFLGPDLAINIGLPQDDLFQFSGAGRDPGASPFASILNPVLKLPLEYAFNRDAFLGADLEKLDRSNLVGGWIMRYLPPAAHDTFGAKRLKGGGFRINPTFNKFLKSMPTSRLMALADRLKDTRLSDEEKTQAAIASFMLGSTHKVSERKLKEIKSRARRALREMRRRGEARSGEYFFPTEDRFRSQTRELQRTLR